MIPLLIAAEAAHHGAEKSGGLPQMDPSSFAGQLFWLAITFVVLYLLLSRVAIPRIATVIEERRDQIADDLDKAGEFKAQADAAVKAYDKAVADAKARARSMAEDTRKRLKAESDKRRADTERDLGLKAEAAEQRISAMKTSALANVRGAAAETAAAIYGRLTGDSVDLAAAEAAVDAAR
jgi:F-type H+-transporting ATPase subunit b